ERRSSSRGGLFGSALDGEAGGAPLRQAVRKAARPPAAGPQFLDCVVRQQAVRSAAISDDLLPRWQLAHTSLELIEGHRSGALDVAGLVLLGRADVDHDHAPVACATE